MKAKEDSKDIFSDTYWDKEALREKLPCSFFPLQDIDFYYKLVKYVQVILKSQPIISVLEIGCAPGRYLIFFGKRWRCKLFGLDKSAVGVEITKNLARYGLTGEIVQADLFEGICDDKGGKLKLGVFDVVMSHGFIEHFNDISHTMMEHYQYARKGGLVITTVPNFNGLSGWITKIFSPDVYYSHRRIEPGYLAEVQSHLGGKVLFCDYTGHYSIRPIFRAETSVRKNYSLLADMVDFPFRALNGLFMILWPMLRYLLPPSKLFSKRVTSIAIKESA